MLRNKINYLWHVIELVILDLGRGSRQTPEQFETQHTSSNKSFHRYAKIKFYFFLNELLI
jgi:hypothetical protein